MSVGDERSRSSPSPCFHFMPKLSVIELARRPLHPHNEQNGGTSAEGTAADRERECRDEVHTCTGSNQSGDWASARSSHSPGTPAWRRTAAVSVAVRSVLT